MVDESAVLFDKIGDKQRIHLLYGGKKVELR